MKLRPWILRSFRCRPDEEWPDIPLTSVVHVEPDGSGLALTVWYLELASTHPGDADPRATGALEPLE